MYAALSAKDVLNTLASKVDGLSAAEAKNRLLQHGANTLPTKKRSLVLLFLSQFNDIMVYILFVALGISLVMPFLETGGHPHIEAFIDAAVIGGILLVNAILGFVQEYKAEEAIAMLKNLTSPHSRVRRGGKEADILSAELVPGDIVILNTGDKVSADGRLIAVSHFRVNESSLTGESATVSKIADAIKKRKSTSLADKSNMVFSGTLVTEGSAEFVVTATGLQTEIGKIATLVSETKFPETPLEVRMRSLGKLLGSIVVALCTCIFAIGYFDGMPLVELLLITVSLAVSAVPEGLPAVVTVCMAMGVRRMAKKNALVRRLESLETLGSVTVICSDKTGTITQNKMTVKQTWLNTDAYTEKYLMQIAASCNRAQLPNLGDPTELGLLAYAQHIQAERLGLEEEIVPFSSEAKYMETRHGDMVFLKGAPEKIFELASDETTEILKKNKELAKKGLRVLACAERRGNTVHFVGLIAMEDPPREGVAASIAEAKNAGIRTIMITGDNPITAQAIAQEVGIHGDVMHGEKLESISQEELIDALKSVSVFARVSPTHKLKILNALKKTGHIVAMSGDGVNDAPALKGAHVGVSMGLVGTEVAREASTIVLADDNFATIVAAISEGRRIYDNIKKFVIFLLRTNFDELLFISLCIFLDLPLPYLALHILWINLMTDSLPALALGMEKAEPDIMKRPPRNPKEHILHHEFGRLLLAAIIGFSVSFILYLYLLSVRTPLIEARSVIITLAILFELFVVISMRSKKPILQIGFFSNKWMIGAVLVPFALQFLLLFTPLRDYFRLTGLTLYEWFEIFCIGVGAFIVFECLKLLPNKRLQPA